MAQRRASVQPAQAPPSRNPIIRIKKPVVDDCESKESNHNLTHAYGTYDSTAELLYVWGKLFSGQPTIPSSPSGSGWALGIVSGCAADSAYWCFDKAIPYTSGNCQFQYLAVMAKFSGVAGYQHDVRRFKGYASYASECSGQSYVAETMSPVFNIAPVQYQVFPREYPNPNPGQAAANADSKALWGSRRIRLTFDDSHSVFSAPIWGGVLKGVKNSFVALMVYWPPAQDEDSKPVGEPSHALVELDVQRGEKTPSQRAQTGDKNSGDAPPSRNKTRHAQLVVQRPWGQSPDLVRREIWRTDDWNPNPAGMNLLEHQPVGGGQPLPPVGVAYPEP